MSILDKKNTIFVLFDHVFKKISLHNTSDPGNLLSQPNEMLELKKKLVETADVKPAVNSNLTN